MIFELCGFAHFSKKISHDFARDFLAMLVRMFYCSILFGACLHLCLHIYMMIVAIHQKQLALIFAHHIQLTIKVV